MDKIIWQLGADSSQVRTEMARAARDAQSSGDRISQSWGRVDSRQRSLLKSNNRVTNQIQGFTRTLLNANSATDILASGLDRLENSLNLSLAGGALLAGGAVVIDQIGKFQNQINELEKAWQGLMKSRPDAAFQTLQGMASQLEKIIALREKLEEIQKRSPYTRVGQDITAGGSSQFGVILGAMAHDAGRKAQIEKLREMEDENKFGAVDKRRARSDIDNAVSKGQITPYEAEAAKLFIAFKEANPAVHELTQATIELNRAFQKLAETASEKKMERAGMSLKEMAATPEATSGFNADGTTWSLTYEQWMAGKKARGAQGLEAQGESARLNMQPELANDLFNQAGEAKEVLTGLKPSEKMSADFKGALAVTEGYLQTIAESKTTLVNK